jgi:hypothetical protein
MKNGITSTPTRQDCQTRRTRAGGACASVAHPEKRRADGRSAQ